MQNWLLYLATAIVVGIWCLYMFVAIVNSKDVGTIGDAFGSLNALFTGLAFVGLIWTVRQQSIQLKMQQIDLKLTREEMKLSRQEIKGTNAELAGQKKAFELQNFQTHLFNLLMLYKQSLNGFQYNGPSGTRFIGAAALIEITRGAMSSEQKILMDAETLKEAKEIHCQIPTIHVPKLNFIGIQLSHILEFTERFLENAYLNRDAFSPHLYFETIFSNIEGTEQVILEIFLDEYEGSAKEIIKNYSYFIQVK